MVEMAVAVTRRGLLHALDYCGDGRCKIEHGRVCSPVLHSRFHFKHLLAARTHTRTCSRHLASKVHQVLVLRSWILQHIVHTTSKTVQRSCVLCTFHTW